MAEGGDGTLNHPTPGAGGGAGGSGRSVGSSARRVTAPAVPSFAVASNHPHVTVETAAPSGPWDGGERARAVSTSPAVDIMKSHRSVIARGLTEAQKLRIRAAFDTFDNDGTGFITAKDLRPVRQLCAEHGPRLFADFRHACRVNSCCST